MCMNNTQIDHTSNRMSEKHNAHITCKSIQAKTVIADNIVHRSMNIRGAKGDKGDKGDIEDIKDMDIMFYKSITFSAQPGNKSDDRLKDNETQLTNCLELILKLCPKMYDKYSYNVDINKAENGATSLDKSKFIGVETGFVAQDVQNDIPTMQHLIQQPDADNPYLSLNYIGLIPYMIGAIQELHSENGSLQSQLVQFEQKLQDEDTIIKEQIARLEYIDQQIIGIIQSMNRS